MSALLEIADSLQDTQAAIVQLEQAMAKQPPTPSVMVTLGTLRKRQRDLETQFAEATAAAHVDVCAYRLFPEEKEHEHPTLTAFTKTLGDFQTLFTQVYHALKEGKPKDTARVTAEAVSESAFGFAYTFSGSVGIMLTLPNERLLFGETEIDRAVNSVFGLIKADSSQAIAAFAKTLGVAPVRTLYRWASDQVLTGLGSQIEWRRKAEVRSSLLIQYPELEELKKTIESTSEETQEELTLTGQLVGVDFKTHRFHMIFEHEAEIRGKMSDQIAVDSTVELPKVYTAKILKTTKVFYSMDKEDEYYYLVSLT